jgi:hypothetical protein
MADAVEASTGYRHMPGSASSRALPVVLHHPDRGGEHDTARCLALMDQVAASGEVLLITKNGPPVAELHPCASTRRPFHRGKLVCSAVILPLAPPAGG